MNSTITLLSSQVGQLKAREEELSAMLKLKVSELGLLKSWDLPCDYFLRGQVILEDLQ